MFCLSIITTAGTFQVWNEAAKQLLGLTASELVTLTGGRHLPAHIEEQVIDGVWQLEVENTEFLSANQRKQLIRVWRMIDRRTTISKMDKSEAEEVYYDAFESQLGNSCRIL